jgi:hypothetical protein
VAKARLGLTLIGEFETHVERLRDGRKERAEGEFVDDVGEVHD